MSLPFRQREALRFLLKAPNHQVKPNSPEVPLSGTTFYTLVQKGLARAVQVGPVYDPPEYALTDAGRKVAMDVADGPQ